MFKPYEGRLPIKHCVLNGSTGVLYNVGRDMYRFRLYGREDQRLPSYEQTFVDVRNIYLTSNNNFMVVKGVPSFETRSVTIAGFRCDKASKD